jgi:hypothetical protein
MASGKRILRYVRTLVSFGAVRKGIVREAARLKEDTCEERKGCSALTFLKLPF